MKISDIFEIIQGHQITDEEIYMSIGKFPIYTGNNEIKGYWDKKIVTKDMLPCLTYPTKGFAGKISVQTELFDANNTAVLYLKNEYKNNKIELEWFKYVLSAYFYKKMTSKEGVSYLNRDIVKDIELDVPNINVQKQQVEIFKHIEEQEQKIINALSKIKKVLNKHIIIEEEEKKVPLKSILSYVSRNDSLSEEGIYRMYPRSKETARVLSGSIDNIIYGEIDANLEDIHYLNDRQALHLVTRGKAGKLTYISKGTYATNTNSFILYIDKDKWKELNIKDDYEEEILLKYLKIYLQPFFYSVSSNSDVSVFPLTEIMKEMNVPKIKYDKSLIRITKYYDILELKENKLKKMLIEIENMKNKMLIY